MAAYAVAAVIEGQPLPDPGMVFLSAKGKDFQTCVYANQPAGVIRVWISSPNDPDGPWEDFLSKDMRIYPGIVGKALLTISMILSDPTFIRGVFPNEEEASDLLGSIG